MAARILRWTLCSLLALAGVACGGGGDGGGGGPTASEAASAAPSAAASADSAGAGSEAAGDGGTGGGDAGDGGTYTVRSGDTLSSIAQEQGTTVEAIVEANDIDDPDVIDIGQELTIPPGSG